MDTAELTLARTATVAQLRDAGRLAIPESLPIAELHDELLATIRDHQVVVVAGETGSGKSTQLPKLCLEAGRGTAGMIGHTQPRRVAARTIAERVAEELGTELGEAVGYTVRFTDRVGERTLVKVMTDGILLAEIQRDRMLSRYDTLIIDEAHERSLNIDFILGYLKQLLPKRPDLTVIVTSATIDTERFAAHFARPDGTPAPIVQVSGRTYPVEVRYRPYGGADPDEPLDDRDQVQAICDAVDELGREGNGDVLVFLSGEREIHDTADALRRLELRNTDVLPLYARLSAVEQHRIFSQHTGRRVVLATNVAETSLTVPGVRYVVDAGTARISRYSLRLKVQRLPIEPISQASANQRAGRCGRVAPGICIRLFAQDEFEQRPEFTEPEILRTNLASVILQMTAIGLGDVAAFPFVEPPDARSIRDGYALLEELGAIQQPDDRGRRALTPMGKRLARLPVDPRLGRMVLEADRHGCVREVLVIAAALSIQDVRERPAEHRQAADEMHRRFAVEGSDFLALVKLWDHLREQQREMSSSQFRKLCRTEYLNYLRVREWQDLFSQLRQVAGGIGLRSGTETAHPDRVHQALLAGLLSHLGMRDDTGKDAPIKPKAGKDGPRDVRGREFRGAHGSRFMIGSGSALAKKPPRWIMAAELVETNRLWARTAAAVQPEWAERLAGDLARYSYGEPTWDPQSGRAVTIERATLYGLPIVTGRRIGYDRVDPQGAREMFLLHALVEGDWETHHTFIEANHRVVDQVRTMQERLRRVDLVDDDAVLRFYDQRVGPDVVSGRHFDRWWKETKAHDPELLTLRPEHLLGDERHGHSLDDYPDTWHYEGLDLAITYRFDPGAPDDGATVHVPLTALNQLGDEGFDWHVPGFRDELVATLVRTLPKEIRRDLVPAAETIAAAIERLDPDDGPLAVSLAKALAAVAPVRVSPRQFDWSRVPEHLRISFVVEEADGAPVAQGHDIVRLQRGLASRVRAAVAAASPLAERRGMTSWDVGDLPRSVETDRGGHVVRGYPALLDDDASVSLRILTNPDLQARVMRGGVRRLLLLTVAPSHKAVERSLSNTGRLAIVRSGRQLDDLIGQCIAAAADRVLVDHLAATGELPWTQAEFGALQREAKALVAEHAADALATVAAILALATSIELQLAPLVAPSLLPTVADVRAQLSRLLRPTFVAASGTGRLADVLRYLQAIERRLDKLAGEVPRDQQRMREVHRLEAEYTALLQRFGARPIPAEVVELGWMLEEHRVGVFAQAVGVKGGVSATKIQRELARWS